MSENLIQLILTLVKQVETTKLNGADKKENLYTIIRTLSGEDDFNKNKEIIDYIIETIIFISKVHVISGINKHTCLGCIPKIGFKQK